MVSNASDDLPDPDRPVNTISLSRGSSRSTLRRLCSRATRIVIVSATAARIPADRHLRTDVRLPLSRPPTQELAQRVRASSRSRSGPPAIAHIDDEYMANTYAA